MDLPVPIPFTLFWSFCYWYMLQLRTWTWNCWTLDLDLDSESFSFSGVDLTWTGLGCSWTWYKSAGSVRSLPMYTVLTKLLYASPVGRYSVLLPTSTSLTDQNTSDIVARRHHPSVKYSTPQINHYLKQLFFWQLPCFTPFVIRNQNCTVQP